MGLVRALGGWAALATVALGCGGIAVIDPGSGDGGAGGGGGDNPAQSGGGGVSVVSSSVSAQGGGPATATTTGVAQGGSGAGGDELTCQTGCEILFKCALDECTGVPPRDEMNFIGQCLDQCASTPALLQIINPDDCEETIQTLKAVSADFAAYCDGAIG
jgi:hypothetical protein